VADRISGILEKLIAAIQTVNEIVDQEEVAPNVRRYALRELCAALQQVVDHDNLWQALYESASGRPSFPGVPDTKAFLESVADVLCEAHAALLLRCGYRSPPPPLAHVLIEQTRKAVLAEHREPRWGTDHVEGAREALTDFVNDVVQHIKDADPVMLNRIGIRIRRTAIGAAFLTLLSQAEIRTGDSFSVDISASVTDPITIEIIVPFPWTEMALAESMGPIVAITSVDTLEQIMDLPFEDPAAFEDPAFEDPAIFDDFDPL
jgi:hypothetical protein